MQQIAFAQLLFHWPPFADMLKTTVAISFMYVLKCIGIALDEASSFLSEELKSQFYDALGIIGITYFSIGH